VAFRSAVICEIRGKAPEQNADDFFSQSAATGEICG
jgi:hypothetical protein